MLIRNAPHFPVGIMLQGDPFGAVGTFGFSARTAFGNTFYSSGMGENGLSANYGYPETYVVNLPPPNYYMEGLPLREFEVIYLPVSRL